MPNRILREGINDSKGVNQLSLQGEVFYRRLFSIADDYGRFEADPTLLRAELFKRQLDTWPESRIMECLQEFAGVELKQGVLLVDLYDVDGKTYLQINNFGQRIRADKRGVLVSSKFPAPPLAAKRGEARHDAAEIREDAPKSEAESYAKSEAIAEAEAHSGAKPAPLSSDDAAAQLAQQPRTLLLTRRTEPEPNHQISEWFEERMQDHPNKRDAMLAQRMLSELKEAQDAAWRAEFTRVHILWCESEMWTWKQGAKCPTLAQWISDKGWRWPPPRDSTPAYASKPTVAESMMQVVRDRIAKGQPPL